MLQTEVITRTLRPGRDPHLHSSLLPHLKTSDLGCRVLLSSSLHSPLGSLLTAPSAFCF